MNNCLDYFAFPQQPASAPAGPGQYAPPPQMMMMAQPPPQMQQHHQQQQPQLQQQQQPGIPQPAVAELISFD